MSKYSGRTDLADSLIIHEFTEEQLKNDVKIYVGDNYTPLKIESYKTLIPYYPHIICSAVYNKKEESIIHITSESSVDKNERDILENYLKQALKIYNKCKQKKIEFNVEEVVKEIYWVDWNKNQIIEIANRVKENGKKANVDGIHLEIHEHYRQVLVDEMLQNNVNPANYGYERFIK